MNWKLSHRADPIAVAIADRHYNRQKIGTPQFVPPGRCFVLTHREGTALWVTSWPFAEWVKHAWPGAWVNSCFRRESGPVASDMIREALQATLWYWPESPSIMCPYCRIPVALVTFIDTEKTHHKRDPGRCYIRAGFTRCVGLTKGGLVVVHIAPSDLPESDEPIGAERVLAFQ